jgi:hypothetical protein
MTGEITVVRASSLSSWADCNRRGAARLFHKEIEAAGFKLRSPARGVGAAIGTAVHRAAEISLGEKAKTGELPPASVATDCASQTLTEQLAEGVAFDNTTQNRTDASRQTVGMTRAYHRVVAPEVEPIIVEERLEAEVSPGLILSGKPDIIAREPKGLRDLKTGARHPGSNAPQIGGYSLLARSHNLDIETASIDFIRRVGLKTAQPDPISKPVPIAAAETAAINIIRHIEADLRTFRHGDPVRRILPGDPWSFQANPASILCSPKWCSAFNTAFCREGDPDKETK